jgi:hypothetical protein
VDYQSVLLIYRSYIDSRALRNAAKLPIDKDRLRDNHRQKFCIYHSLILR